MRPEARPEPNPATRSKDTELGVFCPIRTIAPFQRKRQYKGKLFPNGEFTYGWDSASYKAEIKQSREYQRLEDGQWVAVVAYDEFGEVSQKEQVFYSAIAEIGKMSPERKTSLLNLAYPVNPHKKSTARARTRGITSAAKRMIRNAGWLLQKENALKDLTFWTITIPPLPEGFREYLMQNWGNFKRTIIQSISRRLKNHGRSGEIIEVTEIQEKRYIRYDELYLHSHLLWSNRQVKSPLNRAKGKNNKGGEWAYPIPATWLRGRVESLLRKWFAAWRERQEGGDTLEISWDGRFTPNIRYEPVRSNVVGYLAKYLSKGGKQLAEIMDRESQRLPQLPRQWYYLGGGIRRRLSVLIRPFSNNVADLLNWVFGIPDLKESAFSWVREITITHNERVFRAGLCGQLSKLGGQLVEYKINETCD